jgi:DNA invertase Pin-like site-specific DNA recombinase
VKRAALYLRVSTGDQRVANQLPDLEALARQRGWQIVHVYQDAGISGARTRRPGLDQMLADARQGKIDIVLAWAADRIARSVKDFIDLLTEFDHLGIAFLSYREQLDTAGPLGRAVMVIVGAIAELERNLLIERVRVGMRRARLEGRHIGRMPLEVDRAALVRDRGRGMSLSELARTYRISRSSVCKVLRQARNGVVQKGLPPEAPQAVESTDPRPRV